MKYNGINPYGIKERGKMKMQKRNNEGFTMVELLIVVLLSSVVLTGIYSVFRAQLNASTSNTQVIDMQQNIRAAMFVMEKDIRLAGYSPSGNSGATVVTATRGVFRFTWDDNNDGDVTDANEDIAFGLQIADDADRNGIADGASGSVGNLGRATDGTPTAAPVNFIRMANNIQAVAFAYAFDDDVDGQLDTSGGNVIWAYDSDGDGDLDLSITGAALASDVDFARIRSVRIWILARSNRGLNGYVDNRTYTLADQNIAAGGDQFMRRLLSTTIKCRNMGLRVTTASGA
jgi:type IV pilus assembly protein PilW